ncbi:hypothetical protein [Streptomyces sp. NPDC058291]|jgi:hypothetical protein|uniref:hypothetical protein n=1 Tax=Streptomyces sp. NPDC058291 TaxID=3346427 RepID=UPI0036ECEFF3
MRRRLADVSGPARLASSGEGFGRALLAPRPPVSRPWLVEAVGTADWTGVPLRLLLDEDAP